MEKTRKMGARRSSLNRLLSRFYKNALSTRRNDEEIASGYLEEAQRSLIGAFL
jgi:hypothetical protein